MTKEKVEDIIMSADFSKYSKKFDGDGNLIGLKGYVCDANNRITLEEEYIEEYIWDIESDEWFGTNKYERTYDAQGPRVGAEAVAHNGAIRAGD